MGLDQLFGKLRFEDIEPGDYSGVRLSRVKPPSKGLPEERPVRVMRGAISGDDPAKLRRLLAGYEREMKELVIETSGRETEPSAGQFLLYDLRTTRPDAIRFLEQILAEEYKAPVEITRVVDLPATRKGVREVYFLINSGISKVWVFKADPVGTARELAVYHVAYNRGVPTGKPIGYRPNELHHQSYPFDVAVLGGVVAHAGGPYNALIANMELKPELIFRTAEKVSWMIAAYQAALTGAASELEMYGVSVTPSSPGKEIRERFLAALKVNDAEAGVLIAACERIYSRQAGPRLVSHGDIHTGQVVTTETIDSSTGKPSTSIERFGVIDWGSITSDTPYGDAADFWLHHQRQALKVCGSYHYEFGDFRRAYETAASAFGLNLQASQTGRNRDAVIQSALWNIYELFDPTRKDLPDIIGKFSLHNQSLRRDLDELRGFGYSAEAGIIAQEVSRLPGLAKGDYGTLLRNAPGITA
ncbi:hypothetical protein HYV82_03175 [Candidatus Woesearchaeota archaeon]|nr:hypothetical protein [Candidatus Woesearchaeota archaeon]